jgi:hypothetical protein
MFFLNVCILYICFKRFFSTVTDSEFLIGNYIHYVASGYSLGTADGWCARHYVTEQTDGFTLLLHWKQVF